MMYRVLVTMPGCRIRDMFLPDEVRKTLEENFEVTYNGTGKNFTKRQIAQALSEGAEIFLTGWGTEYLADIPGIEKLKLLAHTGGSTGDLTDRTLFDLGIPVISANPIYAASTAEGTLAYILSALRNIPDETALMRSGGYWKKDGVLDNKGLSGRTVGIIGVGSVAKELIRLMKPFGARFLLCDSYEIDKGYMADAGARQVPLEEVLTCCDIISVHASLTEKTYHMLGSRELGMIRDGALFVNTSRGAVIDEKALIDELKKKRFRAFLDVYENEPPDADSPLRSLGNVYLMPHRGGPSTDLYPYIGKEIAEDMIRFAKGEPLRYSVSAEAASRMTVSSAGRRGRA